MKLGDDSAKSVFFTLNRAEMKRFLHLAARQRPQFDGWEHVGELAGWSTVKLLNEVSNSEFNRSVEPTKRRQQ